MAGALLSIKRRRIPSSIRELFSRRFSREAQKIPERPPCHWFPRAIVARMNPAEKPVRDWGDGIVPLKGEGIRLRKIHIYQLAKAAIKKGRSLFRNVPF